MSDDPDQTFDFNSKKKPFEWLRQEMLAGRKVPGCARCYNEEDRGQRSMRQIFTEEYADKSRQEKFQVLEIGLSNKCNFRCRMCNAENSSAWRRDWQRLYPLDKLKKPPAESPLQILRKHPELIEEVCKIKVVGGEPFLNRDLDEFLKLFLSVAKTPCKLQIATNGSRVPSAYTLKLLSHFKAVRILVSIDALGARAEYIRKGCRWSEVEANLKQCQMLSRQLKNLSFVIFLTLQAYNADCLLEVYRWSKDNDFKFDYNVLSFPKALRIQALPIEKRKAIWNNYSSYRDQNFNFLIEPLKKIFCEDPSEDSEEFTEFTRRLDLIRGDSFLEFV